ncbi:hypothetical protein AMECASPLE_005393 [Ameca splendens]|uniref:Uncharacterized protein n=1 Tax=Ameca splendens TaxID=208324 RepID=A0ABV0Z8K1_9TELE
MQTPPQFKAEKPDATIKPSDDRPTAPTHDGQSCTAPPQHAIQQRSEHSKEHTKQKPCIKPTLRKCTPTSLPKIKPHSESAPLLKEDPQHPKPYNTCLTPIHQPEAAP